MANLVVVPANTRPVGSGVQAILAQAGEAFDVGDVLYQDATTQKYSKASDTNTTVAELKGVAITKSTADEDYFYLQTAGKVNLGVTLTVAEEYVISDTGGELMPKGDLTTGDVYSRFGYATSANDLQIDMENTGVSAP